MTYELPQLSKRETDVLVFVGKGLSNKEVGALMGLSHCTVNDYLKSIFKKLDVNTRVEAAVLACKAGLL